MILLDNEIIEMIVQEETDRINNSQWADLTLEEIELIEDKEKSENTCEKCENENEKTSTISSNPFYVTSSSFKKFDNIILGKK